MKLIFFRFRRILLFLIELTYMLQIDHIYEFLYQEIFKDFEFWYLLDGVPKLDNISISDISIFTLGLTTTKKIFFYDYQKY